MSNPKTLTQADIDAAVAKVTASFQEKLDAAEGKNAGLLDDLKKAQREARAAKDITPEALQAEVDRADKAEAKVAELTTANKTLTTERDKAVKGLETEQAAARSYALEAEITGAIATGNVVPALVPAFKALVSQGAKAEVVDGKYAVTIGDKPAAEHIKALLASDDGKHFVAATVNGGGGAGGASGSGQAGKTMERGAFDALDQAGRAAAVKDGVKIVDQAA